MNKRGQIFLAGALILVIVLMGSGIVYNSARAVKGDLRVSELAKEIKYEGLRVIDFGESNEKTFEEKTDDVKAMLGEYAASNPDLTIFAWFYSPLEDEESNLFYEAGVEGTRPSSLDAEIESNRKYVKITWKDADRNIYYELDLNRDAFNFNVLIERDGKNERTVAAE